MAKERKKLEVVRMSKYLLLFFVWIALFGCFNKKVLVPIQQAEDLKAAGDEAVDRGLVKGAHLDNTKSERNLANINFVYNGYGIRNMDKIILFQNILILQMYTNLNILIEGHCDERGTVEYNLGLGQRRANAVANYYIYNGVNIDRIKIISYGKEKPIAFDSDEASWGKNRRVETKLRKK